ncbi:hypothetical protein [Brevundimonas sp.]|uniref:hypothetical protein n=1 Tax=Brevundimonas sp. TaxID=1871086 RepID=UPI003F6FC49D
MTAIPHTLSALAAGALLLSAAGAAQAQTPYTAYSQAREIPNSCRNVEQLANGYVSAECQADGGWRWSSLRPVDCRSSISNRDGVLTCTGARATVGALYPDDGGYSGQTTQQPGGIIGALLGAVFGDAFGNDQQVEQDYNQGRRPLAERREALEARIDAGIRDGSISRTEATRLRSEYNSLVQLETRYAADGRLTTQERTDLRARYQALSRRVGDARDDGGYDDDYGWRSLADQRIAFNARVDLALRDRRISRTEANRLRTDFDALVRVETSYERDGLSDREREDLTTRLADLDRRIGDVAWDGGYGTDGRAVALEARISAGERNGSISRTEAARLREELRDLTRRWADLEARVQLRR